MGVLALGGSILIASCAKDGDTGPAGADGVAGVNGTNGVNANGVTTTDQANYDAADGIRGGIIYDKFYSTEAATGVTDPYITGNGDFFRCKACHGWDLLGTSGSYIDRGPTATRPNVATTNLRTFTGGSNIAELFNAIKHTGGRINKTSGPSSVHALGDQMPDYGLILADADIWDLVKYLKEEAVHTDLLYDLETTGEYPTGSRIFTNVGKDGVAASGDTYYATNCGGCHGADGTTLDLGGRSIGQFAREKPYEAWHKVKFGQLGSSMSAYGTVTVDELKNLLKAGSNTTNFPDL